MNPNYPQGGAIPVPNPSYPMARLNGSAYAAPLNYNQPSEVVGGYDAKINPMTGEEVPDVNFARGGNVKSEAGLASLLASRGRGDDKMLVHMAPSEVRGLQALAMAHGGSLTINPDTGLYEAGFLKNLLPTIIGAILTPLSGGLINPFTAGLLVGGVEGIRTGDLGKGLMAGLGAYGGAGLSTALAGAGAVASGAGQAGITAAGESAAAEAAKQGAQQAAIEAAKKKAVEEATRKAIADQAAQKGIGSWANIKAGASNLFSAKPSIGALSGMDAFGGTLGSLNVPAKAGLTTTAASALSPEMEIPEGQAIDDSYYESGGYDPVAGTFREGKWRKGYPGFPGYASGGEVAHFAMGGAAFNQDDPAVTSVAPRAYTEDYAMPRDFVSSDYGRPGVGLQSIPNAAIQRALAASQQRVASPTAPSPVATAAAVPPPPPVPQAPGGVASTLGDYMTQLNKFVTSPIAAPRAAAPAPSTGMLPPGASPTPTAGAGLGGMKWDPTQGRFVDQSAGAPNINFGGIPFGSIGDMGMYGSMYGDVNGYTPPMDDTQNMVWDAEQGQFTSPVAPTTAPPATNPFAGTGIDFSGLNFSGIGGAGSYMPQYQEPQYQPPSAYEPPVYQEPAYQEPIYQEPQYQEPVYRRDNLNYGPARFEPEQYAPPTYEPPAYQEPRYEEPPPGFRYGSLGNLKPIVEQADPSFSFAPQMPEERDFIPRMMDEAPVEEFLGTPYMPQPEMTPIQRPSMPEERFYTPREYQEYIPEIVEQYTPPSPMTRPSPEYPIYPSYPEYPVPSVEDYTPPPPMMRPSPEYQAYPEYPSYEQYAAPEMYAPPSYDYGSFDGGGFGFDQMFAGGGSVQYAAAGKLLRGPGDGMSDDIKANISGKQEARLADGEFVIPADVVSHLGNGSSEAGSRRLYKMMADIRKARTGKTRQAPQVNVDKHLPA